MTTLVAGAPLLAGGPPGWVAYGLLAIVTIGGAYMISQSMSNAEEEADKKLESGTAAQACSTCPPPEDKDKKDDEEQKAKDSKRMSDKELDKAAKNNGYKDAHDLKRDFQLDSKYDIFKGKDGQMYYGPRQGTGTPQPMNLNISGPGGV
jgi:Bacterial toxin 33